MKNVKGIKGLEVGRVNMQRAVFYRGQECPRLSRVEETCDAPTSYFGEITDSWETYQTPIGVVERHYWCRGAGLDRSGVDWRLIPVEEISAIQERFVKASLEMEAARVALEAVCSSYCLKGGAK